MSGRKRAQQVSEAPQQAPRCAAEPENMIALLAASGEIFLIDRNCAKVSELCRNYMSETEKLLERAVTRQSRSSALGGGADSRSAIGYCYLDHDTDAMVREDVALEDVVALMAGQQYQQQQQQHLHAHQADGAASEREGSRPPTPNPPAPPAGRLLFTALRRRDARGGAAVRVLYPLIDATCVPAEILQRAVEFMYFKYRADTTTGERGAPAPALFPHGQSEREAGQLIAASVLLGL